MTKRSLPSAEQMSPHFHKWLEWMETDMRLSPNTIKSYGDGIRRLVAYAEISPSTFGPASFDQYSLVETIRGMLYEAATGATSTRQSIYGLKKFHEFCHMRGLAPPYLAFSRVLRAVPSSKSDPWNPDQIFSPDEVAELFRVAGQHGTQASGRFKSNRDIAILAFLAFVGLRTGELVAADVSWVDTGWGSGAGMVVEVRPQGGRRTVDLPAEVATAHQQWMGAREGLFGSPSPDDPLFISEQGERLTSSQVNYLIKSLCREAGVRYRSSAALRNAARQALLNNGAPIDEVRRIMGHRTPPRLLDPGTPS